MLIDEIMRLLEFEPRLLVNDELETVVRYSGDIEKIKGSVNARIDVLDCSFAIIRAKAEEIAKLGKLEQITAVELPKTLSLYAESGKSASCIPSAYVQPYGLSGEGTAVALIDSGIDFFHPEFLDENGRSRILCAWDMTYEPPEVSDFPVGTFGIGRVFEKDELDVMLSSGVPDSPVPLYDSARHGTAVASVAAGSISGVAPKASIIAVKVGNGRNESGSFYSRTTEVIRKYIDAVCENKNAVVCAASGNEGDSSHHFSGVCENGKSVEMFFSASGAGDRFYITLWKNFADTFSFYLYSPSGERSPILLPQNRFYPLRFGDVRASVFFEQPTPYSYSQEIYFVFENEKGLIPEGVWRIEATGENVTDGRFDAWLPTVEDVGTSTVFLSPDRDLTLTLPSTAKNVICVGGYDETTGETSAFSGRGFTRENVYVKPDLVAPAERIVCATPGGGYSSLTGTSVACPFVCGAASLLLEWGIVRKNDPFLFGQRLKAFLRKGASRTKGKIYPDEGAGYGKLCLSETLSLLEKYDRGGAVL